MLEILIVLTSILIVLLFLDLIIEARRSAKLTKFYNELMEINEMLRELEYEEMSNKLFIRVFYDLLNEYGKRAEQYGKDVEVMANKLKKYIPNRDKE